MLPSLATAMLFVFLVPGFLFKFFIYHKSLIKRPLLGENVLHSTLSILIHSSIVMLVTLLLLVLTLFLLPQMHGQLRQPGWGEVDWTIPTLFESMHRRGPDFKGAVHLLGFFVVTCAVAIALGGATRFLAGRFALLRTLMFGPLASLYKTSSINSPTADVLTKVGHEKNRIMYSGIVEEVGLNDGSSVEYIVLRNPSKYYLVMDAPSPVTTFQRAISVGRRSLRNLLLITSENIENIHFQGNVLDDLEVNPKSQRSDECGRDSVGHS